MTYLDVIEWEDNGVRASIWFRAYEEAGTVVIKRIGINNGGEHEENFNSFFLGAERRWEHALGLYSWEDLLRLGVAPGQAFRLTLWADSFDGSYWEPPDFDSGWEDDSLVLEPLPQTKIAARWASVLDRARMLEVCDGYVDLRGRLS